MNNRITMEVCQCPLVQLISLLLCLDGYYCLVSYSLLFFFNNSDNGEVQEICRMLFLMGQYSLVHSTHYAKIMLCQLMIMVLVNGKSE